MSLTVLRGLLMDGGRTRSIDAHVGFSDKQRNDASERK